MDKKILLAVVFAALILMVLVLINRGRTSEKPLESDLTPGDHTFTLQHDGLTRSYKIHVPELYDGATAAPLVIYLHGGAGNMDSARSDGIAAYSDKYGFILAAPEGTGEKKLGKMRASWNGGTWAGGSCCTDTDDVGFISEMIDELKANLNVDPKRIYAMGISNGGLMANRLACELSDRIAAVATVAPAAVPGGCDPSKPVSVMDIHGTGDTCNPYDGSEPPFSFCADVDYKRMAPQETVDTWLGINGCSGDPVTAYQNGDATCLSYQCRGGSEVQLCTVEGMGHTWPSGAQYLSASMVGPVSEDMSTDQIWGFFEKHPVA